MKILLVNSRHYPSGGTEKYYFDLGKLLTQKGHQVAYFSTQHDSNRYTPWGKYFVSKVSYRQTDHSSLLKKISRMTYSFESRKKISEILDAFSPDIVHINNIYYYISPSILGAIKKRHIPIIQTVHDYHLISPNVVLYHAGKIYEDTKPHSYYKALSDRTNKNSYIASFMAVVSSYVQHFLKLYEKHVDVFITPSKFMGLKLDEYGFQAKEVIHLPNFVFRIKTPKPVTVPKYLLYYGRFTDHKGIKYILRFAGENPKINIKLIGSNYDEPIRNAIQNILRNHPENLEVIDFLSTEKLYRYISGCTFVLVPSLWYENQPYSILESYALKKTVVAGNIGGIPEIVRHNHNGLLFDPRSYPDFKNQVISLWNDPVKLSRLSRRAYRTATQHFSPEIHYDRLMNIYSRLKNSSFL